LKVRKPSRWVSIEEIEADPFKTRVQLHESRPNFIIRPWFIFGLSFGTSNQSQFE